MTNLFSRLLGGKSRRRRSTNGFAGHCESLEARQVLSVNAIYNMGSSGVAGTRAFIFNTGTSTFASAVYTNLVPAGTEFTGMGDFNGDGHPDIISKSQGVQESGFGAQASQIYVSLNNGSGSFGSFSSWASASVDSSQGSNTWIDHQIGDFNGDGKDDLLARNKGTGVWTLWTAGTGSFSASTFGTWDPGVQWRDAMVGYFDSDAYLDLLGRRVTNSTAGGATDEWYIGRGTSSATDRGVVGAGGNSWWNITSTDHFGTVANTVVGDFDNDGMDEIAIRMLDVTNSDGSRDSDWLIANPGSVGSLVSANVASSLTNWDHATSTEQNHWRDIQAGDVDGDGYEDILGRTYDGDWWVSFGAASNAMTAASQVATAIGSTSYTEDPVLFGDFTNDGKLDLVYRDIANDRWMISQYSSGSYGTPAAAGGASISGFGVGMQHPYNKFTFVQGSSGPDTNIGSSNPLALLEDESFYLSWVQGTDGKYVTGRYNSNGSFDFEDFGGTTIPSRFSGPSNGYPLRGDFDGDGLQDMLMQGIDTSNPNNWYLAINKGNAYVSSLVSNLPTSWGSSVSHYFRVGDFDGDGLSDVLIQYLDTVGGGGVTGHWDLYISTGTNFSSGVNVTGTLTGQADEFLTHGDVADVDGDGKDDLLTEIADPGVANRYNTVVFFSNGASTWQNEIKWQRTHTPSGAGTFLINTGTKSMDFVRVGDFNGDGCYDVAGIQNLVTMNGMTPVSTGQIWVGLYDGSRTGISSSGWTTNLAAAFNTASSGDSHILEAGNFVSTSATADGYDDIVIAQNITTSTVNLTVYRSTGSGFTSQITGTSSGTYYGITRPFIADVNHDSFDDIVWQSTGINVSLILRSRIDSLTTPMTGRAPTAGGSNWMQRGDTTIRRLRRRP